MSPEELAASLTLLCADALAFTAVISDRRREILVGALREAATLRVTEESEERWFQLMLDERMRTTAAYGGNRE